MRGIKFKCQSLKVILLFAPLLILATKTITGQERADNTPTANLIDTNLTDAANSYFYFDLSFTNNNINSTKYQTEKIPATLLDLSFYHRSGLWTGVLPVIYHNASELSYDIDFSLGFQKFFGNYFYANLYYTNHNYQGDSTIEGIDYQHAINLSIGLDLSWLYLYAEGYSNHGVSNNYFSDFGLVFYKEFSAIFTKEDYFSVMPIISVTFGTDYWYYDDLSAIYAYRLEQFLIRNGYETQNFGYLGFDLTIPVSYQLNNIGIGAAYSYNVPGNKFKKLDWSNQSGIMFSISYLLNLK